MTADTERIDLEEGGRRLPLLLAVVVLVVAGLSGFLAYRTWFAGGGGDETELVTEPVERTTEQIVALGASSRSRARAQPLTLSWLRSRSLGRNADEP